MTDITELAQRITERKFHDWSQSVMHYCDFCNQWSLTVKHENGERICASCCDDEYTSKLEVANAALVEALEKAQQRIDSQREYYEGVIADGGKRIAELESRTVKMPEPFKLAKSSSGLTYYFADDVDAALTDAGIKVEAE